MYRKNPSSLFPDFPKMTDVFVAMSANKNFETRWNKVIAPAIQSVLVNDLPLSPFRFESNNAGDSILAEKLARLRHCRLIFADITTIGFLDNHPIRDAGVMYELGHAQAVRLPEEVILFRSDNDALPFSDNSLTVNFYNPEENIETSIQKVSEVIISSYQEIERKQHAFIQNALDSLDGVSWWMLAEFLQKPSVSHPEKNTMAHTLAGIPRINSIKNLLEIGAITSSIANTTTATEKSKTSLMAYKITEFGTAILNHGLEKSGVLNPKVKTLLAAK